MQHCVIGRLLVSSCINNQKNGPKCNLQKYAKQIELSTAVVIKQRVIYHHPTCLRSPEEKETPDIKQLGLPPPPPVISSDVV